MNKFNSEILALARESKGLTQVELSELLNIEQGSISKIENGKMEMPLHLVSKVASILDYPEKLFYSDKKVIKVEGLFRKKASTSVKEIKQYVAKMTFTEWHIHKMSDAIELPKPNIPSWDVEVDGDPQEAARFVRQYWKIPRGRIDDLATIIENNGIVIAPLDLEEMDGLSTFSSGYNIPIMYVNRKRPADRIRNILAHELGHYVMHFGKKIKDTDRDLEEETKIFAGELLMPENEIASSLGFLNLEKLGDLKRYWKVSMASIVVRAEKLNLITKNQSKYLFIQLGKLGYRKNEPFAFQPDNISLLKELLDTHINEMGYSKTELADLLDFNVEMLDNTYYGVPLKPKLQMRKNKVE